jgi:hypothetical protein
VLRRKPDLLEQLLHLALAFATVADPVDLERRADDLADPFARVQGRVRVLEDDLQLAPKRAQVALRELRDVLAAERDPAVRQGQQADEAAPEGGLSAARLADEPEGLSRPDLQRDVVDRMHARDLALDQDAALDREVLHHVFGGEEG